MKQKKLPFSESIYNLRTLEHLILYDKKLEISSDEIALTKDFLQLEYERESLEYPFNAPIFNDDAAIWAAKLVYNTTQLLLYREHKIAELDSFFPEFIKKITASEILSADLCLRFLPQMVFELKLIDSDDPLINILEKHLKKFHYSAIGFDFEITSIEFDLIFQNNCLEQLYLDRIVDRKAIRWTEIDKINEKLRANVGNFSTEYWSDIKKLKHQISTE